MGKSMGGHGALSLGLKHPDKFKSVSAFHPVSDPAHPDNYLGQSGITTTSYNYI